MSDTPFNTCASCGSLLTLFSEGPFASLEHVATDPKTGKTQRVCKDHAIGGWTVETIHEYLDRVCT